MKVLNRVGASVLVVCTLIACSGAGTNTPQAPLEGVVHDSAIGGLSWRTAHGSGTTDALGSFSYFNGDRVSFSIANLEIGSAPAKPVVTLRDLYPSPDGELSSSAINLARLLLTLDVDADARNGILLDPRGVAAALGQTVNFNVAPQVFAEEPGLQAYLRASESNGGPGVTDLVGVDSATSHVNHEQAIIDERGAPNALPTISVTVPAVGVAETDVPLDAFGEDSDGSVVSYEWRQISGLAVTIADANSAQTTFHVPPVSESIDLVFSIMVLDNDNGMASRLVPVRIEPGQQTPNAVPTVNSASFTTDEDVSFMGRLELADSDGDAVSVELFDEPSFGLLSLQSDGAFTYAPNPDFAGADQFSVRAFDGKVRSQPVVQHIQVHAVNDAPVVNAGDDQVVRESASVQLAGSVVDPDSDLTIQWEQTGGPSVALSDDKLETASFIAPAVSANTVLSFVLRASDGIATTSDSVQITVVDTQAPVANAGTDQTQSGAGPVSLDGTGSSDGDGQIATWLWEQTDGPPMTLSGSDQAVASFNAPAVGQETVLVFRLTVTDDDGLTASDTTQVYLKKPTPPPVLPIADAGVDQTVDEATQVMLDGSASRDPDGEITAFAWTQLGGPAVALSDPASPQPTFTAPDVSLAGAVLRFRLRVTDNGNSVSTDEVSIFVRDVPLGVFRVGTAKAVVSPEQKHIDGVDEERLFVGNHKQRFNLGGFGIDPTQNFPDPIGGFGDSLTAPASETAHINDKGEREETWVRVMALSLADESRSEQTILFVTLDAVGAGNLIQKGLTKAVADATGVSPENILFGQTHSHAGADLQGLWGGVPQSWIQDVLYVQAADAARRAMQTREAVELSISHTLTSDFNNYRRPRMDTNSDADDRLSLLQARTLADGRIVGQLLQYAAHPTSVNEGVRAPHPDYVLGLVDYLEAQGGVALYYNGPIADASPSGSRSGCVSTDGKYGDVRCRGEGMAEAGQQSTPDAVVLSPALTVRRQTVTLPVTNPLFVAAGLIGSFNRYYDFLEMPASDIPVLGPVAQAGIGNLPQLTPTATTAVSRLTIGGEGGLDIVTMPGEATNTFGRYIRSLSPASEVMLFGLTHNSFGYLLPEEEFNYIDSSGDAGMVLPFTGYEEFVSLGPLTVPLLKLQGYHPLFGKTEDANIPDYLAACENPLAEDCIINIQLRRLDYTQRAFAKQCRENGAPEEFCALLDPDTPLRAVCDDMGLPADSCAAFGEPQGDSEASPADLLEPALQATLRGCDPLDPSHCLYPFPSNHFTTAAAVGSIQSTVRGGTGIRVNFNPLAMPRNIAGRPVDPTEWNRNDGFSPGAMLITLVDDLSLEQTWGLPADQIGITNPALSLAADAPISVLEVQPDDSLQAFPVFAEMDANADLLYPDFCRQAGGELDGAAAEEFCSGAQLGEVQRPSGGRSALIIRPASNFNEGRRYIVVLRNLKDTAGAILPAGPVFSQCMSSDSANIPAIDGRCETLRTGVLDVLPAGMRDGLYLAWDFTVASAQNNIGRLRHMRDSIDLDQDCAPDCTAPSITIERVLTGNAVENGIMRQVQGHLTVPSFVVPTDARPLDDPSVQQVLDEMQANFPSQFGALFEGAGIAQGGSLPPNRLYYNPFETSSDPLAFDASGAAYGDGLPDSLGTMNVPFVCQIPTQTSASAPARAGIYGHGLLDQRGAITYDGVDDLSREFNYMFCAVDLFGFSTGDLPNVASVLVDLSNFQVIPDASQQGLLNYISLARALRSPNGFASLAAFQDAAGRPLFDNSEIFYDGNSQGGIVGGAVMAASKDIRRGILGSLGMNYSTLLRRSVDFSLYSVPLYVSYQDELDRNVLFGLMQMLWDRSENNGYAHHITDNSAFGGPDNVAKLDPQFGDHQVTMWSADVMARTMGIPWDGSINERARVNLGQTKRHPDVEPGWGMTPLDYANPAQTSGSALVLFDMNRGGYAEIPPISNTPPSLGVDPHDNDAKDRLARCHKAHFLRKDGQLVDVRGVLFDGEACPPVPPVETGPVEADSDGDGVVDSVDQCPDTPTGMAVDDTGCPQSVTDPDAPLIDPAAFERAVELLSQGDALGATDAVLAGLQQNTANALRAVMVAVGEEAGVALPAPADKPAPVAQIPQALQAGIAKAAIQVPVGTPLGGYLRPPIAGEYIPGAEAFAEGDPSVFFDELVDFIPYEADACDPSSPDDTCAPLAPIPDELRAIHSPYTTYSPPSRGYYDSLIAKAVALYDGQDYIVLVKTDFIGMLNEVVEDVKADVLAATGVDLGDGLIMSATHTHDGPGAMANHSTRYFWLAMDVYQHDVYRKIVSQLSDVVVAAMNNRRPAKIGHAIGRDTKGLNGYRRGSLPEYDATRREDVLKRLGVLRIDDATSGATMAVVINWAAHGIAFDVENQFFSGDVLGAVERETEQLMRIPLAMLVQSASGDVSPRGNLHDNKLQRIEAYGKRLAPQVAEIAAGITQLQSAPDLRAVSQRVILDRDRLGYGPEEYPYPWGGGQCGNDIAVPFAGGGLSDIPGYEGNGYPEQIPFCLPSTPPDPIDLADNGVAENGSFYPQDAIVAAARIGDITLLVQPGEPLTEYGVRLLDRAEVLGFPRGSTFIWGYSGDHVGYILPPEEEDWATLGGAESTTTFWGWKQGARFLDSTEELLLSLRDALPAPRDEFTADYSRYRAVYDALPAAQPTPSLFAGSILIQPTSIRRFSITSLVFEGGDPVVDTPKVELEKLDASGNWVVARRNNGERIDTLFELHLEYRLISGRHLWSVIFEAPKDWPTGSYRLQVAGSAVGPATSYQLTSDSFDVLPAENLLVTPLESGRVALAYPSLPNNYRVVDAEVRQEHNAPLRSVSWLEITRPDGTKESSQPAPTITGVTPPQAVIEVTGEYTMLEVKDGWGNIGRWSNGETAPAVDTNDRGSGLLGLLADAGAETHNVLTALLDSNPEQAAESAQKAVEDLAAGAGDTLSAADPARPGETLIGLDGEIDEVAVQALSRARDAAPVVITGKNLPGWSVPAAYGVGYPYPSGAATTGEFGAWFMPGSVRNAHNGEILYPNPQSGAVGQGLIPVESIAAYRYEAEAWVEIPVQVDEMAPYFLANANSDFSTYSGTDPEVTYVWDNGDVAHSEGRESWMMVAGVCDREYPAGVTPVPDPVAGLDDDDEIAFMYSDAGDQYRGMDYPEGWKSVQMVTVNDPLLAEAGVPAPPRTVYLVQKDGGSSFGPDNGYVRYQRDAKANQWIDRRFFADNDPEKLGTSNTGYGPNLAGDVCLDGVTPLQPQSTDRFPRDGLTVTTATYQWKASGRWMVRDIRVRSPQGDVGSDGYWDTRPDLIDRWKGRAFQQSPDSVISLVGFEDEQVNWEANAGLLGERCGAVRCMRETWGADSGTNVTKTETFFRDAVSYRYRLRVHPIPSDGLYTSWDYNRSAMVPTDEERNAGIVEGRYFTALRPQGVPIDGINDDFGNVDGYAPIDVLSCIGSDGLQGPGGSGTCPAFFDGADPTFNIPLAFDNWEQVSGKGDGGSLIYSFELIGLTSLANPLVVPYYRDDACLDDGTGDDPVPRPWPGESYLWSSGKVPNAYDQAAGRELDHTGATFDDCLVRQGAHGSHGVHYFFTHDTDNLFTPTTSTEVDSRQWQYIVPSDGPTNLGEPYANNIRAPLTVTALPVSLNPELPDGQSEFGGFELYPPNGLDGGVIP